MPSLFTKKEIKIIQTQYPIIGQNIVRLIPGHSLKSIRTKAEDMGIKVINHEYRYKISKYDSIALAVAIDCEGTISLCRWKRNYGKWFYHSKVSIYNTDFRLIKWANNIVKPLPRYVTERNREKTRNEKWKHQHQIDVRGVNAVYTLLKRILPYFILKKQRATLLLDFCHRRIGKPIRQPYTKRDKEIHDKISHLNKRGPLNSQRGPT